MTISKHKLLIITAVAIILTTTFLIERVPVRQKKSATGPLCPNCNIILVTIDSLRRDHLGLYGYNRQTSRNLDRWAKDALIFDQYIAAAYLTPISEMSLQTGLYPSANGLINFETPLAENKKTLAEILKENRYTTIAIGSSPEFYFQYKQSALHNSFRRGFDQAFDDFLPASSTGQFLPGKDVVIKNWADYNWPKYVRGLPAGALDWIKNAPQQKFYFWLSIGTVHGPYNARKPYRFTDPSYRGVLKDDELDWGTLLSRIYKGYLWNGRPQQLSGADTQFIRDRYDDGIFMTDQFLGELFKTLRQKGLEQKTIVIVTSEHGEDLGEHGYFAHYDVFDDQIRVPFIMKIPGVRGKRVAGQVSSIDVLPTILETLGAPIPSPLEGKSFVGVIKNKVGALEFRPYAFFERTPLWEERPNADWLAPFHLLASTEHFKDVGVRTPLWKLIARESRAIQEKYSWWGHLIGNTIPVPAYELYNLKDDPMETTNVIDQNPGVAGELKAQLLQWKREIEKQGNAQSPRQFPAASSTPKLQPYF